MFRVSLASLETVFNETLRGLLLVDVLGMMSEDFRGMGSGGREKIGRVGGPGRVGPATSRVGNEGRNQNNTGRRVEERERKNQIAMGSLAIVEPRLIIPAGFAFGSILYTHQSCRSDFLSTFRLPNCPAMTPRLSSTPVRAVVAPPLMKMT